MIRHKATGEFMPELRRTRGYSHWNPSKFDTREHLKKKLLGVPRLFASRRIAHRCIVQWNSNPNSTYHAYQTHDGEWDDDITTKADGRSMDDLEIVEVNIEIREN
jgi:hypothetical protein